jgi:branched-chain amino acid aminotransferase
MSAVLKSQTPGDRAQFSAGAAFVDGRFIPASEASVPIGDWGFLHSDATYDVVHVWNGAFFRLDDHLDRFAHGMAALRMSLTLSRDEIRDVLVQCVKLSGLRNAYVEMICTRGIPGPGSRDPRSASNRFYAFAIPFIWLADPQKQEIGLDLHISTVQRIPSSSVDPRVKNYHWLDLVAGLFEAYDHGAETTLLTDTNGNVVEGPGFNLFTISGGRLSTPSAGVLEGITRKTVLELAAGMDLACAVRPVSAAEVRSADEVFATSTAGGIVPVTRVDGAPVGGGKPGPHTLLIRQRYWDLHRSPEFNQPVDYD